MKFSAAAGYSQLTDEGCSAPGVFHGGRTCSNLAVVGGGGAPFQNYRQDGQLFQVGASIMHVPSGLFAYGLYQNDQNDGTPIKSVTFGNLNGVQFAKVGPDSAANETTTWFVKAGIKRAWMPVGATVLWGEWGQYNDMFRGLCGNAPGNAGSFSNSVCENFIPTGVVSSGPNKGIALVTDSVITGSEVDRWGIGVVQEIDLAAMHVFARWQHLELNNFTAKNLGLTCVGTADATLSNCANNNKFGKTISGGFQDLDIFQVGGVIFF